MSNFAFLNNDKYLNYPACRALYENVSLAEGCYFSDHEKCALKVRFVLEQFCVFVSEMKRANYPENIFMLGSYWNRSNEFEFIRVFGKRNADLIKSANRISCSFLHDTMPSREDCYPDMLRSVYILLLWLYKELGFRTKLSEKDYDTKNIPENLISESAGSDIVHSSEALLQKLGSYFPGCNTDKLCTVEEEGGRFIVRDLEGNKLDELITPEKLEYSEADAEKLRSELAKAKKAYERKAAEFLEVQLERDNRIAELENELKDSSKKGKLKEEELSKELYALKNEKESALEDYGRQLSELGRQYDELNERYEQLLPVKEQQAELQKRVKELLNERQELELKFLEKQDRLQGEIAESRKRLKKANESISDLNAASEERSRLINSLEKELSDKETLLKAAVDGAQAEYKRYHRESSEAIKEYQDKLSTLEQLVTKLMDENLSFKEKLSQLDNSGHVQDYLMVINEGIEGMSGKNALYSQSPQERQLRDYLRQVKEHYESRIAALEEELRRKEEERQREKQHYEEILHSLHRERYNDIRPTAASRRKKHHALLPVAAAVLAFLSGVTAFFILYVLSGSGKETQDNEKEKTAVAEISDVTEITDTDGGEAAAEESGTAEGLSTAEILENMAQEVEDSRPLVTYRDIPGISPALLKEIDELNVDKVIYLSEMGERYHTASGAVFYGERMVPSISAYRSNGSFYPPGISSKRICRPDGCEKILFSYQVFWDEMIVVAADVSDVCGCSTRAEIDAVLGNNLRHEMEKIGATDFSSCDNPVVVLYGFYDRERETFFDKCTAVVICYDADGNVCDNAYIAFYTE